MKKKRITLGAGSLLASLLLIVGIAWASGGDDDDSGWGQGAASGDSAAWSLYVWPSGATPTLPAGYSVTTNPTASAGQFAVNHHSDDPNAEACIRMPGGYEVHLPVSGVTHSHLGNGIHLDVASTEQDGYLWTIQVIHTLGGAQTVLLKSEEL